MQQRPHAVVGAHSICRTEARSLHWANKIPLHACSSCNAHHRWSIVAHHEARLYSIYGNSKYRFDILGTAQREPSREPNLCPEIIQKPVSNGV